MRNQGNSQKGQIIGRGSNQRVLGTAAQERARAERNSRMQRIIEASNCSEQWADLCLDVIERKGEELMTQDASYEVSR